MSETVLVVDDQPGIRKLILTALAPHGYDLIEAENGAKAVELSKTHKIDLLITDIVMPDLSGPDLVSALNKTGVTPRVLMITGHSIDSLIAKGIQVRSQLLRKPFSLAVLVETVASILSSEGSPIYHG